MTRVELKKVPEEIVAEHFIAEGKLLPPRGATRQV
jgi:hypothetical protein